MKSYLQMQQEAIKWQQSLKPGDEVLIAGVHWERNKTTTLKAVVTKITDKQIKILTEVDGVKIERKFYRHTMGEIIGVSGINDFICLYPVDTQFSAWEDAKNYMFSFPGIRWNQIPLETLAKIATLLDKDYRDFSKL